MKPRFFMLASFAATALHAAPALCDTISGDATQGAALFASNCAACHSAVKGAGDEQGPNLYGVYGRKAGSEPGFAYSDGFAKAGFSWNAAHLDAWLTKPTAVISSTYMMYSQPDPKVRADIIAYLKTLSAK